MFRLLLTLEIFFATFLLCICAQVPKTLTDGGRLPSAVIFDLDDTLWAVPKNWHQRRMPFSPTPEGNRYIDSSGKVFWRLFDDVQDIIPALSLHPDIQLAIASTNPVKKRCMIIMKSLRLRGQPLADFFHNEKLIQIRNDEDPGCKSVHFVALRKGLGTSYRDMVFFDDLPDNVQNSERVGMTGHLVGSKGLTTEDFDQAILRWRHNRPLSPGHGQTQSFLHSSATSIEASLICEERLELTDSEAEARHSDQAGPLVGPAARLSAETLSIPPQNRHTKAQKGVSTTKSSQNRRKRFKKILRSPW